MRDASLPYLSLMEDHAAKICSGVAPYWLTVVGLDVHAETISAAIAQREASVRDLGTMPNREESVRKLVKKLAEGGAWAACYEAGPTGYALYWQLSKLGIPCVVVAPTLVPMKAGDRVKTDRRDAARLASSFRAGELTAGVGTRCCP
jgi:transposase